MSQAANPYSRLMGIYREVALLESCSSLLQWDQETFMPGRGVDHRAEQLALLAGLAHRRFTDPLVGELLAACENGPAAPGPAESVNLREIRRKYDKKTRLPCRLVEELAQTTTQAHPAWVEARKKSDFGSFSPWLKKIVALKREQAQALGWQDSPYDPLVDDFEPGETESSLSAIFSELCRGLAPLIEKIADSGRDPDTSFLSGIYPVKRQQEFGRDAAAACGFDFSSGRLDEVVHPFCTGIGPGDTRITASFDSSDFCRAFFGILHEAGHGMYDQGLDPEHYGAPLGEAVSVGLHESQSRIWENFVGLSRPFWEHFLPRARAAFPEALGRVSLDSFLRAVNRVAPSFIRIEADELTYNLHVILRFELESLLISGELDPAEVPAAWNERFRQLLGVEVPDDRRGCLQDTHWSNGIFGYFPTYCLGNLYAAQFFAKARRDIPGLDSSFARGSFSDLLAWLRENIHCHGMRFRAGELVEKATGKPLSTELLLAYLQEKYTALYNL
ncbi:MAG: carboxypeptidase M32 [Candidatus Glassbacteria bacterium]|nr:carboxypeptidase M32 [Candidatus Glassbacteria bacterium]